MLQKNNCKFISIPCNTAHHWFEDLKKTVKIPILNMPKIVYEHAAKNCRKNSKIGLLATDTTIKTGVYNMFFNSNFSPIYKDLLLIKLEIIL